MQNILFRADSSSAIGLGHIMRDLVLAQQFKDANIFFAVQNLKGNINHKIEEKNYKVEILSSNDLDVLDNLIKELNIDMIVIDHYDIDSVYEKQLKIKNSALKILSFDDTYEKHYCGILLNHNIYADSLKYKNLVPENCELKCGEKFTLLREEFKSEKVKQRRFTHNTKNILIIMGGTDQSNLNIKILKILENFSNIHTHIVTTTANQYLDELQEYVTNKNNATLHINTNHIAKLMNEADFAIVTPSVTVNEVVYMEVPFIAIKTADNQYEMYKHLAKNDCCVLERFDTGFLKNKIEKLLHGLNSGGEKIELVNFSDLSLDEKKIVLKWRNYPNIRKWMFTQKVISLDEHLSYIDSLKERENRFYFLVKRDGEAIGVIDFNNIDMQNSSVEFGIYANPILKCVGDLLMDSIIDYAFNVLKVKTLISEVFEDNMTAIKLYIRHNFKTKKINKIGHQSLISMELKNENR